MDITILFKACIKTMRTTNKALEGNDYKLNILRLSRKDSNLSKPKEILKQISDLQHFFLDKRAAYLNVVSYLSTSKPMTETEREQIDSGAQNVISTCTNMLHGYKKEINSVSKSKQREEHYVNVIESVENYLQSVSKMYTEAKAIRVKRVIETHKLSRLETKNNSSNSEPRTKRNLDVAPLAKREVSTIPPPAPVAEPIENKLSAEEMQMFESENELLFNELNNLSDEVKQMESKVVHISELQELFTDKVLQQEKDIERIATTVATTTDNMKDANEQVRQAIQRNAGLRVWVLFFLLVMSFSLLFLDWYND